MRPLLVVDGDNLAHRAFHALPQSITGADGKPANMLVGFTNALVAVWDAETPRAVLVAFDTLDVPTYRHELLPAYQSEREFAPQLLEQLARLPGLVEAFGFQWVKAAGYEADDFIAAAVRAEEARGGSALVLTNDRDLFQLAGERTTILRPARGVRELQRVGPDQVREIYGVEPEQVPDFIALRGDPSDRIPGAKGIGPGRAARIVREYGSVDEALQQGLFGDDEEQALRTYLRVARLQYEAPVPDVPDADPDWRRAAEWLEGAGLRNAAERIGKRA